MHARAPGDEATGVLGICDGQVKLFKLVSGITGFKNSFKGIGYLLGAVLVTVRCVAERFDDTE